MNYCDYADCPWQNNPHEHTFTYTRIEVNMNKKEWRGTVLEQFDELKKILQTEAEIAASVRTKLDELEEKIESIKRHLNMTSK